MSLKDEFLVALQSGQGYEELRSLARRHVHAGLQGRAAYDELEQIWLDYGFNDSDDESDFRNNLEAVTERLWYFGRP
jgi:hypothetical protein